MRTNYERTQQNPESQKYYIDPMAELMFREFEAMIDRWNSTPLVIVSNPKRTWEL